MDFTTIGSVSGYLSTKNMQNIWQNKKNTKNYTAKSENSKSFDKWIEEQQEKIKNPYGTEEENQKDKTLTQIRSKLDRGAKLTSGELEYLRKKDPVAYSRHRALEAEKAEYKRALKRCRTKEDVQKLKMSKIGSALSVVNAVKNDPHISPEKKLEAIKAQQRRITEIDKITTKFVVRGEYSKLPADHYELRKSGKKGSKSRLTDAEEFNRLLDSAVKREDIEEHTENFPSESCGEVQDNDLFENEDEKSAQSLQEKPLTEDTVQKSNENERENIVCKENDPVGKREQNEKIKAYCSYRHTECFHHFKARA